MKFLLIGIFVAVFVGCSDLDNQVLGGAEMLENPNLKNLEMAESLSSSELNAVYWLDDNWEDIFSALVSKIDEELHLKYPNRDDLVKSAKRNPINIYVRIDKLGNWDGYWLGVIKHGTVIEGVHVTYTGAVFDKLEFKGIHSHRQIGISKRGLNLYFLGKINPDIVVGPIDLLDHEASSEVKNIIGNWELTNAYPSESILRNPEGHLSLIDAMNEWSERSSVKMKISSDLSVAFNVNGLGKLDVTPFDLTLEIYRLIGLGGQALILREKESPVINSEKELLNEGYWITSTPSHSLLLYGHKGDNWVRARFNRKDRFFGSANPNPNAHKSVASWRDKKGEPKKGVERRWNEKLRPRQRSGILSVYEQTIQNDNRRRPRR